MNSPIASKLDLLSLSALVKAEILQRFKITELGLFESFFSLFWRRLSKEDWEDKSAANIAACIYNLWTELNKPLESCRVCCFNPSFEEHGWTCNGTAIIVHHKDMPFLIDSLRLALNEQAIPILVIKSTLLNVGRDASGTITAISDLSIHSNAKDDEALIFIEVGLLIDMEERVQARKALDNVLADVRLVVGDYRPCMDKVESLIESLEHVNNSEDRNGTATEAIAFLTWLKESHFTFLGYREYECDTTADRKTLVENEEERLGLFKNRGEPSVINGGDFPPGSVDFYRSSDLIAFSKSSKRATVHRPVYPDYVVVKRFDGAGNLIGEGRFIGLFTFSVYNQNPREIPFIRQKVTAIVNKAGLTTNSHDGKNMIRVLDTFPRDELFQSDFETLFHNVMGIASISERRVVRLFMRSDRFSKFVSFLVYVPRDIYTTAMRKKIEKLIGEAIHSSDFDSTSVFSESILARAHIVYKVEDNTNVNIDPKLLEAGVIDIAKGWDDRLEGVLVETFGDTKGLAYHRHYSSAFPVGYQEIFDAHSAVQDIELLETLSMPDDIAMHFFHSLDQKENHIRFKVLHLDSPIELSDVIPILENLGLRVIGEMPFKITKPDGERVWLHVFDLAFGLPVTLDVQAIAHTFEEAFSAVWHNETENDGFNRLVLGARLQWREVTMLRAYSAYMKQTLFNYATDYIADILVLHPEMTRNLVALFKTIFDPRLTDKSESSNKRSERLTAKLLQGLDEIQNINEDRIVRRYLDLITATLRTNFFQKDSEGLDKHYISIKFNPRLIADIPEPKPRYEIFVYSPRMEGVHLRTSKVARGGLRWSDRLQDYRTEVLGLVKAQQVKNAVIVPSGAKGGFVCKKPPLDASREALQAEGIECYKIFIRGLLDITDNYQGSTVVRPEGVVCQDDEDPYLVVAADKGTASFSDIANKLSLDYGHWLGDAFASGGSQGYDHKGMGITAKGAWVGVQRHFREMNINIQEEPFTVIGIGDMSGDVFGNGMLLSNQIKLVAAFNHAHIFIDPNPDTEASFNERTRLFAQPRSQWSDYNQALISEGGGIFSRQSKTIDVSPQMQSVFDIDKNKVSPTELLTFLLKASVDLIWNGGIGTYVKSSKESHADVGDKSNDGLRVNGKDLHCKVFGEGGNLGMTQLGRVEFALAGGRCNTDFIDNAAGVDCSDHEVNIKILLDQSIQNEDLTEKQRNKLLVEMTDEVSDCVLDNNYKQTATLSMALHHVAVRMGDFKRFISFLEKNGGLDRTLEFLPDEEAIQEREKAGQTLTRPELAILLSYAKVLMKDELIRLDLAQNPYARQLALNAFPPTLQKQRKKEIIEHQLIREIVGTQVANDFINDLGITAIHRLRDATGEKSDKIALAYLTVNGILKLSDFKNYLRELDFKMPTNIQYDLTLKLVKRVKRGMRWFLSFRREALNPSNEIVIFAAQLEKIYSALPVLLQGEVKTIWESNCAELKELGVSDVWIPSLAIPDNLFTLLSVIEVARQEQKELAYVCRIFIILYEKLRVRLFCEKLNNTGVENYWQATAKEGFLDDIEHHFKHLVKAFINAHSDSIDDIEKAISDWLLTKPIPANRWYVMADEINGTQTPDFAMFSLGTRELIDLAQSFKAP